MSVWDYMVGVFRGLPTPPPSAEEQRLADDYQKALGKVREASEDIRGRSTTLSDLKERIGTADELMRDALGGTK